MQLQIQCPIFVILPQTKFLLEVAGILSQSQTPGLQLNLIKVCFSVPTGLLPQKTQNITQWTVFPTADTPSQSLLVAKPAMLQVALGWERPPAPTAELGTQWGVRANQQCLPEQTPLVFFPSVPGIQTSQKPLSQQSPHKAPLALPEPCVGMVRAIDSRQVFLT